MKIGVRRVPFHVCAPGAVNHIQEGNAVFIYWLMA